MANKNTEVVDISKKSRVISILSFVIPLFVGYLLGADSMEEITFVLIIATALFWFSNFLLERGKITLRVGSIIDKDKRFYLYDSGKKIDSLRIRIQKDVSEKEILKRFEEFLRKNNLNQYSKVYLLGTSSKEDTKMVQNILNK